MLHRFAAAVALLSSLSLVPSLAQSDPTIDDIVPDLTQEQQAGLSKSFGLYTNALTVFTGLNSVSSGTFTFEGGGEGEKDADFQIFRLPASHTFGEHGDLWRPQIRGVLGTFSRTQSITLFSDALKESASELPDEINAIPNDADFLREDGISVSAGAGVAIEPIEGLVITPAFDFIWTHYKQQFDYHNFLSALIGVKYDRDIFNTSVEALSYAPSTRISYAWKFCDGLVLTPSADYTHVWTYDSWSKSQYADFESNSGVLRTSLEAQIETPWKLVGLPLGLHPYFVRTDLSGAAHESLGFSYFHDVGLDFTFDVQEHISWVHRLRVGGAYIFSNNDFSGYRLGVSLDI